MDFDSIYTAYFKDVFMYLRSLSANADIAEEITQETFEKALKSIDRFDGKKDIRAWLFTIAKNSYYTYCKKQKHFVEEVPECLPDTQTILTEQFQEEETVLQIHKFLHNMKEPYKEVFTLRVFGELPYEKIGAIFGKSSRPWMKISSFCFLLLNSRIPPRCFWFPSFWEALVSIVSCLEKRAWAFSSCSRAVAAAF